MKTMRKINQTLASKLILSILLMAIPIYLVSMGILFAQSQKAIHEEAMENANSTLNATMQRVRNYMTIVETATNSNLWFVENNFRPDSLLSLTNRIVKLNRHVSGCSITAEPDMFPEMGRYFSAYTIRQGDSVITEREAEYDYYSKVWYKTPATLGKPFWIDPFDDYNEGTLYNSEIIAAYGRPLYHDGKLIGVMATDLSLNSLDTLINTSKPPYPGAYFVLMGSDGSYYIHPDTTKLFKKNIFTDFDPQKHADMTALGREMTKGNEGAMHVKLDGKLYHVCYQPVEGTDWSLALVCLDSEILKNYNHLSYIIGALTIIGLLLMLWLCRKGVNHAIHPLKELLTTTQKISEGQYDLLISHTDREDAIGRLQNSFATMLYSINTHMDSIRSTAIETQKSNEELAHAMKLAEEALMQKTIFIQNVSHQIRTPLNIIQGFSHVLRDSPHLSKEELAEIIDTMNHNSLHLNRMVLMLFDSSDMGITEELISHRDDVVSCNKLVGECISHTREHFPTVSIQFLTDVDDNFRIQTSHIYLMRTLRELLYNSAKYSDGQNIIIRITHTESVVRFTVEDKGQGLSDGFEEKIFNPFIKIDDLSEGLGLGLPLAKRHAGSLGGDLTLDTSYHEGCRFTLEIPRI